MESLEKKRGNSKGITSDAVSKQVRRRRQELGLDLAALSNRLSAVDWPIPVAALSRLENGQRRIDVDDLMALSVTLETTPNRLLLPEEIDFGPGTTLPSWLRKDEAELWLSGALPLDPDLIRRYWIARLGELRQQLNLAQKDLQTKKAEMSNEASGLLADFLVEEAQSVVQHWTNEVNKLVSREAELREVSDE